MRFVCPLLDEPIKLTEGKIKVVVIENPVALRNLVQSIKESNSKIVLSDNFKPVELLKYMEFISDIFDVDFVSKNISSKINSEVNSLSLEYHNEINEVYGALNSFGQLVTSSLDFPASFSFVQEPDKITKLLNFAVDTDGVELPEKVLEYMNIYRRFFKKKVFAFLNLKCFLSYEELIPFYKNIAYEGYRVLLIESHEHNRIDEFEDVIVIDNDLCII